MKTIYHIQEVNQIRNRLKPNLINIEDLIKILQDYQRNNVKTVSVEMDEEKRVKIVPE